MKSRPLIRSHQLILPLRLCALLTALCFAWSLVVAPGAQAAAYHAPVAPGHVRALTPVEMHAIVGAQGSQGPQQALQDDPGPAMPWVASVNGINTGNGNKLTSLPLVGWTARGGLPVAFTLSHSSQSSRNSELGQKWIHTYDISLAVSAGDLGSAATVTWGDEQSYTFTGNGSGAFTAPTGIHEVLVQNIDGTYTLTRHDMTQYHFNANLFCDSISDENGNTVTLHRSSSNQVTSVVDPTGRTLTLAYDSSSRLHTVTDPLSRVWTLTYDASNQLTQVTYPAVGGSTYNVQYGYNSAHDITSITDLKGNVSTLGYNTGDGIAWEKDPCLNQTSYAYTATSTTITDPNGHATVYTYDSSGRVSQVKDALLDHEDYQYDSANNKTQVTDKNGHAWVYTYDTYGNLLTAQDPLSHTTTYTYNSHNKPLTTALPSGRSVAYAYNAYDNLTQVQEKDSGGTVKATTTLTYPATSNYGLPSSKTDTSSHTTSYAYDANGYLSSLTTPLGHQTQWTYDVLGFKTSREDALSRTTTYTPDGWERLVTTTYPDTTTHTFTYDADSNLTGFADPVTGSWFRTYDADDRMTAEGDYTTTLVSHAYDAAGQKGLLSTTSDYYGRTLTYAYSARDELSSVSEAAGTTTYAYDANGNPLHAVLPNGVHTDQDFNADNTLDSDYHGDGAGTIYQSYGYSYDADRRITSFNEGTSPSVHTVANPTSTAYTYDGQGHLSSENRTGTYPISQVYTYDGVGNRTNFNNGSDNPYTYDSDDEPTGAGGVNTFVLTYNANGDRTGETFNGSATSFGYDYDDQLTSLTANGVTTTFQYDALGRQTRRTVGGTATVSYYDGAQVLFESNSDGSSETAQYTWGNGLIRKDGEYPLTDGRANVRLTTDASRNVTSSNTPDAFGINSATSGSSSGYQWNGGAGYRTEGLSPTGMGSLYSFQKVGARYYDPTFGCFLTRDTYLDQAPYAYCDGDPVNEVDPDGHAAGDPPGGRAPYPPLPPFNPNNPPGIPSPPGPIKDTFHVDPVTVNLGFGHGGGGIAVKGPVGGGPVKVTIGGGFNWGHGGGWGVGVGIGLRL